jgi:hypothetical protein
LKKIVVALAVAASLAAIYLVKNGGESAPSSSGAPAVNAAGVVTGRRPGIVFEDRGHFQAYQSATIEAIAENEQIVEQRVPMGDTENLVFNVRERGSRSPRTGAHLRAQAYRGHDAPVDLPVKEDGKGKYEVAFTAQGPGQFNVVLSEGGIPIGSRKVGVVGAVGADSSLTDPLKLDEADPQTFRARTPGRMHTR